MAKKYSFDADLLAFITSEGFRQAPVLPPDADDLTRAVHHLSETGDFFPAVGWYVAAEQDLPHWLGKFIDESGKPKHGGRHSRQPERLKQFRSDLACFFAVRNLMADGVKQTPAEKLTGDRMHLTRQSVHEAFDRIRIRYASKE